MKRPTYSEIANDYRLWMEYVDPAMTVWESEFSAKSENEKIEMIEACFGPEDKSQLENN